MKREDYNPELHTTKATTATVEGGRYDIEFDTTSGRFPVAHSLHGPTVLTPLKIKPLYNAEQAVVEDINGVNEFLRAAGVKRRFVCFPCGDRLSADKLIDAAREIGFDEKAVIWAMERSGGDRIEQLDVNKNALAVLLYDVAGADGALSITACGYGYRDYSSTTWEMIKEKQESYFNAYLLVGRIEGDVANVYTKPDSGALDNLYQMELRSAPIIVAHNAKGVERDIKAYKAAWALCEAMKEGKEGRADNADNAEQ